MYLTEIMYFITHLRPSVLFNSPMTLEEKKKKSDWNACRYYRGL